MLIECMQHILFPLSFYYGRYLISIQLVSTYNYSHVKTYYSDVSSVNRSFGCRQHYFHVVDIKYICLCLPKLYHCMQVLPYTSNYHVMTCFLDFPVDINQVMLG